MEFSLLPAVRFLPLPKWTQWGGPAPQMLISHVLFLMFYPQILKFSVYYSSLSSKSYLGRFLWSAFNWSSSTRTQIYFTKVKVHWGCFPFFPSVKIEPARKAPRCITKSSTGTIFSFRRQNNHSSVLMRRMISLNSALHESTAQLSLRGISGLCSDALAARNAKPSLRA